MKSYRVISKMVFPMDPIEKVASHYLELKITVPQGGQTTLSAKEAKKSGDRYQKEVDQVYSVIQEYLRIDNFKLNFRIDQETKIVVVEVIDAETGEVIREIPSPELLAIAKEMEKLKGMLFNSHI